MLHKNIEDRVFFIAAKTIFDGLRGNFDFDPPRIALSASYHRIWLGPKMEFSREELGFNI